MTTNPILDTLRQQSGVYIPNAEAAKRLVLVYTGLPGDGKTHKMLTMPEPIVIFDIDHGLEGVIEKFHNKDITIIPITWPDEAGQLDYKAIWVDMMEKFQLALTALKGTGGTIAFDTFTELVELAEWAFVGKINEIPPTRHKQYQAPLRSIVRDVLDSGLNGAFIHKWGPAYGKVNEFELKGYKDIAYQVQAEVLCTRDGNGNRMDEIVKCRVNGPMQGMVLPSMDFPQLLNMVWS